MRYFTSYLKKVILLRYPPHTAYDCSRDTCALELNGIRSLTAPRLTPMSPEPTCVIWMKFVGSPIIVRSILRLRFCNSHTENTESGTMKQHTTLRSESLLAFTLFISVCAVFVTHGLRLVSDAAAETHPELCHALLR